jgi:glycosyltransferase involved in cell wall biosynthesis
MISVLHISAADNLGGSARSAYKIHAGVRNLGFQSKMLVAWKDTDDNDVAPIRQGLIKLADKAVTAVTEAAGWQYLYLPSSARLLRHPWYRSADIIQLYNTHGKYFSHSVLPAISREKPIVWRLSDMWPMTGHCAYAGVCDKWQTGCQRCPDLETFPRLRRDTAAFLWKRKQSIYQRSQIHVVAPSRWMHDLVRHSPLLGHCPLSIVHNGIDGDVFHPAIQAECRRELKIPFQGRGILFLASDVTDARKGGRQLPCVIRRLWESGDRNFFVMLVGRGASQWEVELPCPVWRHDEVSDNRRLAAIYGAACVLVHLAPVENLPNSILEAMACARPVAAFDAGGVAEVVLHQRTGWLAPLGDQQAMAQGLRWILECPDRFQDLSDGCRRCIEQDYSLSGQAAGFADLYRRLVTQRQRSAA